MQQVLERIRSDQSSEIFEDLPRQSGKTTACIHYALEQAGQEGKQVLFIVLNHATLRAIKDRTLDINGEENSLRSPVQTNTRDSIEFTNGGRIKFLSQYGATDTMFRGRTLDLCIMDEYFYFSNFERIYEEVRPVCQKIIALGTSVDAEGNTSLSFATRSVSDAIDRMRRVIGEVQESDLSEEDAEEHADEGVIEDVFTKDSHLTRLGIISTEGSGEEEAMQEPDPMQGMQAQEGNSVWRI